MPAVKSYASPWEAAQALVADHVLAKYGLADADPLKLVAEIAFEPPRTVKRIGLNGEYEDVEVRTEPEIVLSAARTLLKYTRAEVRSVQMTVSGEINHEHVHRQEAAITKTKDLLDSLAKRRYLEGNVTEGEMIAPISLEAPAVLEPMPAPAPDPCAAESTAPASAEDSPRF